MTGRTVCSHDMSSVFVIVYMLSLLCLPPTLAGITPSPEELVSLLDKLPSLQTLVLYECLSRYVSLLLFCTVDTLCVCYYLLCTLTG